jgi:DNA-binding transcriptional regulator YdaS (Cro superfamily)
MSKKYTEQQLREHVRRCMGRASQKDMANVLGVSPQHLNAFLQGRREAGSKICMVLGVEKYVLYVARDS